MPTTHSVDHSRRRGGNDGRSEERGPAQRLQTRQTLFLALGPTRAHNPTPPEFTTVRGVPRCNHRPAPARDTPARPAPFGRPTRNAATVGAGSTPAATLRGDLTSTKTLKMNI